MTVGSAGGHFFSPRLLTSRLRTRRHQRPTRDSSGLGQIIGMPSNTRPAWMRAYPFDSGISCSICRSVRDGQALASRTVYAARRKGSASFPPAPPRVC